MTSFEIFSDVFVLTGDGNDPRNLNFTFLTHARVLLNGDNTPDQIEYYLNYDSEAGVFSGLAVKSTFTYFLQNQVVVKRVEDIEWYLTNQTVGTTKQLTTVYVP